MPVDTSSQASMEEGEVSWRVNPVNISPIAAMCSSCSGSPTVDLMELKMDANLATDHMLSVKRSTDLKRQWVIWGTRGIAASEQSQRGCIWQESQSSLFTGGPWHQGDCAKAVLEAKCNYRGGHPGSQMIRGSWIQESEIAYSKALGKSCARAQSISRCVDAG